MEKNKFCRFNMVYNQNDDIQVNEVKKVKSEFSIFNMPYWAYILILYVVCVFSDAYFNFTSLNMYAALITGNEIKNYFLIYLLIPLAHLGIFIFFENYFYRRMVWHLGSSALLSYKKFCNIFSFYYILNQLVTGALCFILFFYPLIMLPIFILALFVPNVVFAFLFFMKIKNNILPRTVLVSFLNLMVPVILISAANTFINII